MIVITGGLGFIGYNLIIKLNSMKINNIIIVDYKKKKFNSLKKIKYKKFIDVNTFYKNLKKIYRMTLSVSFTKVQTHQPRKLIKKNLSTKLLFICKIS